MAIVAFVSDLMFRSKIDVAARAAGRPLTYAGAGDPAAAVAGAAMVLVDLGHRTLDPIQVIAAIRAASDVPIIAFGSHVDEARLAAARDAGAGEALPRSTFSKRLAELLRREENG
jgi:DNA-binding NarL/FixJ family response regulator